MTLDERHPPIRPRRVEFDWAATPLHWIPGRPFATQMINVLHLLLPAGERWFVHVYKQTLPLIDDERLRAETKGFMGQEAVHARAHSAVLDHMLAHGQDPRPYTDKIEWMFGRLLGDRPPVPFVPRRRWLVMRVAIISAIEHYTAVLGQWVLDARALDRAGADPTMLDLLRWHGAEEVEHRSVAFDVYQHVSGNRLRRIAAMAATFFAMWFLWDAGIRFLLRSDPVLRERAERENAWVGMRYRHWGRGVREGLLPGRWYLLRQIPKYARRGYHPSEDCSTRVAIDYLTSSPAANAAGYDPY